MILQSRQDRRVEGDSGGTEEGVLSLQKGGSGQQGMCLLDCDRVATSDLCNPCLENDGDHISRAAVGRRGWEAGVVHSLEKIV